MDKIQENSYDVNLSSKILVVDDQEPFLKLFKRFFTKTNISIDGISNPFEAVEILSKDNEYDLVVLDIMMPGLCGYDVCRKIRENFTMFELPVLFLTARKENDYILEAFQAGGNDYITKPFEAAELIARTNTLIRLKKLYHLNKTLNLDLMEQNKFLQMHIHDLKNPLTSIIVLTELVKKELINDPDNSKNLDVIHNSANFMYRLVEQILEFNQLENKRIEMNFAPNDFDIIISQVFDVQKPLADRKNQNLIIRNETNGSLKVIVDSEKVVRAVNNILGNAIKFTPHNKTISACIKKTFVGSNEFLRLEIADEGPGFTDDDLTKVFSKQGVLSAKSTGGESSTGLGLLIAKKLIEQNNGNLWIDREYREGGKVIIELPIG